jgi:hypothetical protein
MDQSGIEYPKLTIEGREYEVKFSRSAIYRLDKAGFDLRSLPGEIQGWFPRTDPVTKEAIPGRVRFSVVIDILHAAIGDQLRGTPEQLAELVGPERVSEVLTVLVQAMAKTKPPTQQVPVPAATGAPLN